MSDEDNQTPPPPSKDDEVSGGKLKSRWMSHVKKTMRAHKGKSLKEVLKMAKKTYKGGNEQLGGAGGVASNASPFSQSGGRRRRGTRKSRKGKKGSRKH